MWRRLEKSATHNNAKSARTVWWLAECLQCCRGLGLSNHTRVSKLRDIPKTSCYLGILRKDSNSQNVPLAKLHCLCEPWLLVASSIHRLDFFCSCFLDNHSRFPPELLLLCSLIKTYMLPLADLICRNSINFCRCNIDSIFIFSNNINSRFFTGW